MIKSNNCLETPRTYLRTFALDDLELLYALHRDPQVMRYFQTGPRSRLTTGQNLRDYITHQAQHGFSNWAVFDKNSGEFIGRAGPSVCENMPLAPVMCTAPARPLGYTQDKLRFSEDCWVELSYVLHQQFWGIGLATELACQIITWVFQNLTVPKIIAVTAPAHLASQRVLLKAGMQLECERLINGLPAVQYAIWRDISFT